jgi:hypothetical protein
MLALLVVFGPGRMALDAWLEKRAMARCRPDALAMHVALG